MAAALALLGLVAAAAEPAPRLDEDRPVLTRREVAAMTPEALTRKLFGDMAGMLYPVPSRLPEAGQRLRRGWLESLEFLARPRRASRAGICETDALRVAFEPAWPRILAMPTPDRAKTAPKEAPAPATAGTGAPRSIIDDLPVQPRRITMSTRYFVHDVRLARRNEPPEEDAGPDLEAACASIDPREKPPIFASSDHDVGKGVELLSSLIDAARSGRLPAPAECRDHQGARLTEQRCRTMLGQLDVDALLAVDIIGKCADGRPELFCVRLDLRWETNLRFEMEPGKARPLRILLEPAPDLNEII